MYYPSYERKYTILSLINKNINDSIRYDVILNGDPKHNRLMASTKPKFMAVYESISRPNVRVIMKQLLYV